MDENEKTVIDRRGVWQVRRHFATKRETPFDSIVGRDRRAARPAYAIQRTSKAEQHATVLLVSLFGLVALTLIAHSAYAFACVMLVVATAVTLWPR